jgi:hypothetical protein
MILSKSLLGQVDYYETKVVEGVNGYYTKVILHFKQWWKPKKVFRFDWKYIKKVDKDTSLYRMPEEAQFVLKQLEEYFKRHDDGWFEY